MPRWWALLVVIAAGCPHSQPVEPPVVTPSEGIAIAVYAPASGASFGVVDDRRTVSIDNGTLILDRIDPAATLPSLVIEALDGVPFEVGTCARDRIDSSSDGLAQLAITRPPPKPGEPVAEPRAPAPAAGVLSPLVRCRTSARPGKHFVRVLQVAPTIALRIRHLVTAGSGTTASVVSRFAMTAPTWNVRAEVTLYDGVPGGEQPPRLLAHGPMTLDGSVNVIATQPRDVMARVRPIYDGAVRDHDQPPTDPGWGRESRRAVWMVLELDDANLPSGVLEVHTPPTGGVARDVSISQLDREEIGTTLRVPLWVDESLHGVRRNDIETFQGPRGRIIVQRIQLSVANSSDDPHEVWIEERLRPGHRDVRGTPAKPTVAGDIASTRLVIPPHGTERVSYTLRYD